MSKKDGWAAINLEMPEIVPRFEPSAAEYHWELVQKVTGIDVDVDSSEKRRLAATQTFVKSWDYGIYFGCLIGPDELSTKRTYMGHAEYAQRGRDFDDQIDCPFDEPEDVLNFDPWEAYGERDKGQLVERFNKHYRQRCDLFPTVVNTTGIYITLLTGMEIIFGWEMLLKAAALDSERFGQVVNRYASWVKQYYEAVAQSEAEVIYSHDDMVWSNGPFLNPKWYEKYIFPNLRELWEPLRKEGKQIMFVCDGDYTQFASDIADCGNDGFWFEIFTDLEYMTNNFGSSHFLIGNLDTRILTTGRKEEIKEEVERCMRLGKPCPGYFICTSGHIPPNVPVENALYYNELYKKLRSRRDY